MLAELSFSPSIFLKSAYSIEELCESRLAAIRKGLLECAMAHDLREGGFSKHVLSHEDLHPKAKELLKKLQKNRRLHAVPAKAEAEPGDLKGWIDEAVASAEDQPVKGIIVCENGKTAFQEHQLITDIAKCPSAPWWAEGAMKTSWLLARTQTDYQAHLRPLIQRANFLAFFDPHLDPSEDRFAHLPAIFEPLRIRSEKPTIEFHRIVYKGSGDRRRILDLPALEAAFKPLSDTLKDLEAGATVFVWADDHNRYLITDLGSFQLGNSLDESEDSHSHDVWSRIERSDADTISRKHDPAVATSRLRYRFQIGATI